LKVAEDKLESSTHSGANVQKLMRFLGSVFFLLAWAENLD